MAIGQRLRKLRQAKGWSQAHLGQQVGVHQKQISAYERGAHTPSTEVLIKLAEVFDVTLDYLAFEAQGQPARLNIQDRELLRRFELIDRFPDKDKELAKDVLDLLIFKHRFNEFAATGTS